MHEIFNKPLVSWVISACENIGSNENIVVVGHKGEEVQDFINKNTQNPFVCFKRAAWNRACGESMAKDELKNFDGLAIILNGDIPLITAKSLQKLVEFHQSNNADITAITAILDDPKGYGRIIRDENNHIKEIVEQKDCNATQDAVKEINVGMYCLNWQKVKGFLMTLK